MATAVSFDIALEIVKWAHAEWLDQEHRQNEAEDQRGQCCGRHFLQYIEWSKKEQNLRLQEQQGEHVSRYWSAHELLALRLINQSFRLAVNVCWFQHVELKQIKLQTLTWMNALQHSPSICPLVTKYEFAPIIRLFRPGTKNIDSRQGLSDPRFPTRSLRNVKAEFIKRENDIMHYEEQFKIMHLQESGLGWFLVGLKRLLSRDRSAPPTSRLYSSSYFSAVSRFSNLICLKIQYYEVHHLGENSLHYLIKNDFSAGLASILVNAPLKLEHLSIIHPSMTDIKHIVYFLNKMKDRRSDIVLTSIKELEIRIFRETLEHRGRSIRKYGTVDAHHGGGAILNDFLKLFPNVEQLILWYIGPDYNYDNSGTLVLQHFAPSALQYLQSLHLHGLALRPETLLTLTANDKLKKLRRLHFSLLTLIGSKPSWGDIVHQIIGRDSPEVTLEMSHKMRYLNLATYNEQVLEDLVTLEGGVPETRDVTEEDIEKCPRYLWN